MENSTKNEETIDELETQPILIAQHANLLRPHGLRVVNPPVKMLILVDDIRVSNFLHSLLKDELIPRCGFIDNIIPGVFIFLSALSGIAFFNPARTFIGSETVLGNMMGVSTLLCFGSISSWMARELFIEIRMKRDVGDDICKTNIYSTKMCKLTLSLVMGVITSVPQLYISYVFNGSTLFWPIFSLLTFLTYRTNGFYWFIQIFKNAIAKISCFKDSRSYKYDSRLILIDNLQMIQSDMDLLTDFTEYVKTTEFINTRNMTEIITRLGEKVRKPHAELWYRGIPYYAFSGLGGIIISSTIVLNCILAQKAFVKFLSFDPYLAFLLSIFCETPDMGALLTGGTMLFSTVFVSSYNLIKFPSMKSLVRASAPGLLTTFGIISLVLAAFSFGVNASAVRDEIDIASLKSVLLPIIIVSDILFHTFGLFKNFDGILSAFILLCFAKPIQNIALTQIKTTRLLRFFKELPDSYFSRNDESNINVQEEDDNFERENDFN